MYTYTFIRLIYTYESLPNRFGIQARGAFLKPGIGNIPVPFKCVPAHIFHGRNGPPSFFSVVAYENITAHKGIFLVLI